MLSRHRHLLLLVLLTGWQTPLAAQEGAPVRTRLVDSLRAGDVLLLIGVTSDRMITYQLVGNDEVLVTSQPLIPQHVDDWSDHSVELLNARRDGPGPRPAALLNALLVGRSAADPRQFVLLVSDGTREAGLALDSAGVNMLMEISSAAVLATEYLTEEELLLHTQIMARPVKLLPSRTGPAYPMALRAIPTGGMVIARVVVDSRGRTVRKSIVIVSATDPALAASVKDWLPRARFSPAMVEGRRVGQRITVPITFQIVSP